MTQVEEERQGHGNYNIRIQGRANETNKDNIIILQCFERYTKRTCLASFANDPRNCINIDTNKRAVGNCIISLKW